MSVTFRPTDISKLSGKLVSLKVALISLLVVHFFGALGLAYEPLRDYFQMATPLNLLITALLLFSFHQAWNISFYIFATVCFAIGYFVEVAGIHTGEIFGEYHYGPTLGLNLGCTTYHWAQLADSCLLYRYHSTSVFSKYLSEKPGRKHVDGNTRFCYRACRSIT